MLTRRIHLRSPSGFGRSAVSAAGNLHRSPIFLHDGRWICAALVTARNAACPPPRRITYSATPKCCHVYGIDCPTCLRIPLALRFGGVYRGAFRTFFDRYGFPDCYRDHRSTKETPIRASKVFREVDFGYYAAVHWWLVLIQWGARSP